MYPVINAFNTRVILWAIMFMLNWDCESKLINEFESVEGFHLRKKFKDEED